MTHRAPFNFLNRKTFVFGRVGIFSKSFPTCLHGILAGHPNADRIQLALTQVAVTFPAFLALTTTNQKNHVIDDKVLLTSLTNLLSNDSVEIAHPYTTSTFRQQLVASCGGRRHTARSPPPNLGGLPRSRFLRPFEVGICRSRTDRRC